MRVLFLNQYFPPDPAPTGVLLADVADELRANGDTVDFVAAREGYRGAQTRGGRMQRELTALARMLVDGLRRPRADVIFSASSPPCLLIVATLLAWRHRANSVHWAMDLYPEIAVALGEVRDGLLIRILQKLMRWCYRRTSLVVALDRDMAEQLRLHGATAREARPWVARAVLDAPQSEPAPAAPWAWIYSGNLGRAHEWETLLETQALLEERGVPARLIFQGGGPSWEKARARAEALRLRRCEWRDYVPETELRDALLRADCCVVTQRPEARGLLWPSKLALLLSLPRQILFIGPPEGDIARLLGELPHVGIFAPGDASGVAEWIALQAHSPKQPTATLDARTHRAESLAKWRAWMRELSLQA